MLIAALHDKTCFCCLLVYFFNDVADYFNEAYFPCDMNPLCHSSEGTVLGIYAITLDDGGFSRAVFDCLLLSC